ncbi:MAG TPA: hypothetical protein VMA75_01310 [Candidatus Paceibacterota bacterium]|nr:hypothetical protein [Candidatus Paceibacterota bacterium]
MHIPLLSTITLCAELIVTTSIYFIIRKAYTTGVFLRWFAFGVLAYELLFNITYMFSRELKGDSAGPLNPYETAIGAFHGIFSLIMFVALIVFFLVAAGGYRKGENYFLKHRRLTITFVYAWGLSILSGVGLFISLYIH